MLSQPVLSSDPRLYKAIWIDAILDTARNMLKIFPYNSYNHFIHILSW